MSFNEWKEVNLGDVSLKITKGTTPSTIKRGFVDFGISFFKSECLTDRKLIDKDKEAYIDEETHEKMSRSQLQEDDVLLSMAGAYLGKIALVTKDDVPSNINQAIALIRLNRSEAYSEYIYYYLSQKNVVKYINSISSQSAQPNINLKQIGEIPIKLPPIEEQKAIAKILSDLDNKIEVNNKINKRLEDMAQSIFKHWFVDFEFPNEEGKPYKSSGGDMVESELGMIPKGWEAECIYSLAEYINGTSFKSKDLGNQGLPIIKIAELKNGITDGTKFFNGEKDKKFYLKNRDILFSWSGNPDTSIDTFIWDKGDAILNQHIFKVVPNSNCGYSYVYTLLRSLKSTFTNIARNKQTTGLGHVTVKDLKNLKVALNYEKINEFNKIIEPIINKIINNNNSTINITQLRDNLLPKLMSGEIRVPIDK